MSTPLPQGRASSPIAVQRPFAPSGPTARDAARCSRAPARRGRRRGVGVVRQRRRSPGIHRRAEDGSRWKRGAARLKAGGPRCFHQGGPAAVDRREVPAGAPVVASSGAPERSLRSSVRPREGQPPGRWRTTAGAETKHQPSAAVRRPPWSGGRRPSRPPALRPAIVAPKRLRGRRRPLCGPGYRCPARWVRGVVSGACREPEVPRTGDPTTDSLFDHQHRFCWSEALRAGWRSGLTGFQWFLGMKVEVEGFRAGARWYRLHRASSGGPEAGADRVGEGARLVRCPESAVQRGTFTFQEAPRRGASTAVHGRHARIRRGHRLRRRGRAFFSLASDAGRTARNEKLMTDR